RIHEQGCTIILVEQSVNVALTLAERAYFMEKGEVRFSGPTAELLERGDILRSVFLEGAGSVTSGQQGGAQVAAAPRRRGTGERRRVQAPRISPPPTGAENAASGLERHIDTRAPLAARHTLPAMQESEEDVAFTVDDLIELMNRGAFRDKFVSELSTGTRRIVDLAMAIAHDPSVLILDDPSSGLAQRETEALGPLLRRVREES